MPTKVKIISSPEQPILEGQEGIVIARRIKENESAVKLSDGKYVWVNNDNLVKQ